LASEYAVKILYALPVLMHVISTHYSFLDLITLIIYVKSVIYKTRHYEVFSSRLLPLFSWAQLFSTAPSSETPSIDILTIEGETRLGTRLFLPVQYSHDTQISFP
jgi:hypothetical protein